MDCGEVIAETNDYLVLNKAPGIGMHSENGAGLIEQLRRRRGDAALFPVHRLDKVTSGVLLLAKTTEANRALSMQFQNAELDKFYLALLDKKPRKTQGEVRGIMLKARNGSWRLGPAKRHEAGASDKINEARTHFKTWSYSANKRLAILRPLTGKTHQIRVALKAVGAPIRGDDRYGGKEANRCYLHAWYLRFMWEGRVQCFNAPLISPEYAPAEEAGFGEPMLLQKLKEIGTPFELPWPTPLKLDQYSDKAG